MRNSPGTILALTLALVIILGGCASKPEGTKPIVIGYNADSVPKLESFRSGHSEYVLGVGDTIEVAVFRNSMSEFVLWYGDVVNIKVFGQDDLTTSFKIDSSGRIMFPLIGDIKAAGKDIFALRDEIAQKLAKFVVSPSVTIYLDKEQGLKISDLSITDKIDDSGKIIFPTIGDIQAAGKNVFELRDEIQKKLGASLINPMVTIKVASEGSHKIMVVGEVKTPSILTFGTDITLVEALVKSGGATIDAKLDNVIIIRKGKKQNEIYTADAENILMGKTLGKDLYLRNGDIVYVPAIAIADVSRIMSHVSKIISPVVLLESGIAIWPDVEEVVLGTSSKSSSNIPIAIPTQQ